MSSALGVFARTFLIGLAVAAPVGAMAVVCMQRTLATGWRAGIATGAGIATADALYAGLAAFGVAAVSSAFVSIQTPLRIVGGLALVALGVRSVMRRRAQPTCDRCADEVRTRAATHYTTALGLTLTNPMTIMAFGAVFASAGLAVEPSLALATAATAGVAAGSFTWWVALVLAVSLARAGAGETVIAWVSTASGVVIAGFGLLAVASALV